MEQTKIGWKIVVSEHQLNYPLNPIDSWCAHLFGESPETIPFLPQRPNGGHRCISILSGGDVLPLISCFCMMTSSNGIIFRVTGPLCGEFTGHFPSQRSVTRSFDVFFDLCRNKRLNKHLWGWWFGTPSRPLWRHSNVIIFLSTGYGCTNCPLALTSLHHTLHRWTNARGAIWRQVICNQCHGVDRSVHSIQRDHKVMMQKSQQW